METTMRRLRAILKDIKNQTRVKLYHQNWVNDLRKVSDILEKNGIHYWLDGGALLGAIRNGGLIKYDTDIDLGILFNDDQLDKIISSLQIFSKEGFHVALGYFRIDFLKKRGKDLIKVGYFLRLGSVRVASIHADIWRIQGGKAWSAWTQVGGYSYVPRTVPKRFFEKLSTVQLYDLELPVPSETEGYLEYRYGKNWRIPDKNWVYYEDDETIDRSGIIKIGK